MGNPSNINFGCIRFRSKESKKGARSQNFVSKHSLICNKKMIGKNNEKSYQKFLLFIDLVLMCSLSLFWHDFIASKKTD